MIPVKLSYQEPHFAVGHWDRVLLIRFVGAPSAEQLQRVRDEQREVVKRLGKVAMFTLIEPRSGLNFDEKARRRSSALLAEMRGDVLCGVQIVLKAGFFASIIRSVMFGVNALGKPPYPTRVCASIEEAADFVSGELSKHGQSCTAKDLQRAADEFMSLLTDSSAS